MGYHTDFDGAFHLDKPLSTNHLKYLQKFSETRRMKRNPDTTSSLPDPIREAANLDVGVDGGYFVGAEGYAGQNKDSSIISYNHPPRDQPGLWCQWIPNSDGTSIEWDGGEKFYEYVSWIEYIIDHFLKPWGYILNGAVRWRGEEFNDMGIITITNNKVETKRR